MNLSLLQSHPREVVGCDNTLTLSSHKILNLKACASCRISIQKLNAGVMPSNLTHSFVYQERKTPSKLSWRQKRLIVGGGVARHSSEDIAAGDCGRQRELARERVMRKFQTFVNPRNVSVLGLLSLALDLLEPCYAHGANSAINGCADNTKHATVIIAVACIVEAIALTGAAVGGILARQRKAELERINSQLRQIFARMRRQYQVESYAPTLTYAPAGISRLPDLPQTTVDPRHEELRSRLKAGKKFLREQIPERAFEEFGKALPLTEELKDIVEQKKALRGLGASCQRQGKFKDAIRYHSTVLNLSKMTNEHTGDTEALGAIADCYTELGDLETAGKYYDMYIDRLDGEYD